MGNIILKDESYQIIGACFEVYNELGCGLLEAVYHECLIIEFTERGIPFVSKPKLRIRFKDQLIDKRYEADFVCYDKIILEIKSETTLTAIDDAHLINYLKITSMPLGLLANFGSHPNLQHKRMANTKPPRSGLRPVIGPNPSSSRRFA